MRSPIQYKDQMLRSKNDFDLSIEQREMLIQILQRRMIEQRRDEIAQDAKLSLAEYREGS